MLVNIPYMEHMSPRFFLSNLQPTLLVIVEHIHLANTLQATSLLLRLTTLCHQIKNTQTQTSLSLLSWSDPHQVRFYLTYGSFLKWGYPHIIHLNGIFHCKPSIWGYPHLRKPPYILIYSGILIYKTWSFQGNTAWTGKAIGVDQGFRSSQKVVYPCLSHYL